MEAHLWFLLLQAALKSWALAACCDRNFILHFMGSTPFKTPWSNCTWGVILSLASKGWFFSLTGPIPEGQKEQQWEAGGETRCWSSNSLAGISCISSLAQTLWFSNNFLQLLWFLSGKQVWGPVFSPLSDRNWSKDRLQSWRTRMLASLQNM